MARRPDRNQNVSAARAPLSVRRDPPRENMPRGTFLVARNLRTLAESMPNLLTDKAVRAAKAHSVQASPVRSSVPSPVARPVAKASAVATQKPDQRPANRAEPDAANTRPDRTCKRRPSSTKGNGFGRPFVPWCK